VGYCYPSGLEETLCKWDIYVPLVRKGLRVMFEENCSMERNSLEQSNNKQLRSLQLPANTVISGFRSEVDENCALLGEANRWDL